MIEINLLISILEQTVNEWSCPFREYGAVTIPADSSLMALIQENRRRVNPRVLGSYFVKYDYYPEMVWRNGRYQKAHIITQIYIEQTSEAGGLIQEQL